MGIVDNVKVEHQHELRLAIVFGCFLCPTGYLLASVVTSDWGWTPMLAEVLSAIFCGIGGLILGSVWGGRLDRASEKIASGRYTKSSATGREHSSW